MKKRIILLLNVIVLTLSLCACEKNGDDGVNTGSDNVNIGSEAVNFWVRGWYISGKNQPMLITNPEYYTGYEEAEPIALTAKDGVDLSGYVDGDVIEIEVDAIFETWPCQADVYDVRFIENGDVKDIDKKVMEQLEERGWID